MPDTVQEQVVCQGQVDLGQVQADELYTKTQAGPVWIATAMTVFSRLWLWGAISWERDAALIEPVIEQVRAAAQPGQPILFAVDGFKAYVTTHPEGVSRPAAYGQARATAADGLGGPAHRASREAARRAAAGQHHAAAGAWQPGAGRGDDAATQVELGRINTAYIERLNATLRTWMPALVRRTRTPSGARERLEAALFWTGCVYNFCHVHATLAGTPAMAADLTDHVWSIDELIRYRCQRE